MMLLLLIAVPLIFAVAVAGAPESRARVIALAGTLIPAAIFPVVWMNFERGSGEITQFPYATEWLPALGLQVSVAIDGVSLLLLGLTVLLGPLCVACSFTSITERQKTYYAWMLVLQAAMTGVFCARDVIFFYVCFEFTLIPMFILISLYGSTNRARAAVKFFLYTFTGSILTLAGVFYVAWRHAASHGGVWSFDIVELAETARGLEPATQAWILLALVAGFGVKVPLFPFHTWLPLAHTEAPTAGSVILAGTLLKLGTYGLYRFGLLFVPQAMYEYSTLIATVCVVGILYGGLICWVQRDVKKLVAYSSVAHLGFCILGLVALNQTGLTGSVLYMVNHGLSTGALFLLIGMVYERYHTRSMRELGGLAAKMPVWATFMVFFVMASVGLPGLNGFIGEFLCLLGAFQAGPVWGGEAGLTPGATPGRLGASYALVAGLGMIVAAIYLLYMVGKVVFGPLVLPPGHGAGHEDHGGHGGEGHGEKGNAEHGGAKHGALPVDLNAREISILTVLAIFCIWMGVYPSYWIRIIEAPVSQTVKLVERTVEFNGGPARPRASAEPAGMEAAP